MFLHESARTGAVPLAATAAEQTPLSALAPAGAAAAAIAEVWWWMFWGSLVVLLLVCALALHAVLRRGERPLPFGARTLIFGGGIALPLGVITVLLFHGVRSGDAMLPRDVGVEPFRVEITARQWWWEVRYPDVDGAPLYDANELLVPVGRPVDIVLEADDVIHSFWVPRLGGKLDAIPGRTNVLRLTADESGVYRGLCAEFCGAQHARMGFHLLALEPDELERRLGERAAAGLDEDGSGPEAFAQHCGACHSADGRAGEPAAGPNLAAVRQRRHLVAGWLQNESGRLRQWLDEHQTIKPGNRMSDLSHVDPAELDAIAEWLEGR